MTITTRPMKGPHPSYIATAQQGALRVYGIGRTQREAKRRALAAATERLSQIANTIRTMG